MPVPIVADLAEDEVEDDDRFIDEFETVIERLSKGHRLSNGEFS